MAVHRRQYQAYAGSFTSAAARVLVVPRYAIAELFGSRLLVAFLLLNALPLLVEAAVIYLSHSVAARTLLGIAKLGGLFVIDNGFFRSTLSTHCFLGFILAAWVGPGLVAADLTNGALPLYLSRPLSRSHYVFGKAAVLLVLMSAVTWLPCLLLYSLNCVLAESGWWFSNIRSAFALVIGSLVWIGAITLFTLALSAWIKWRLAASAMLFGVFFVSAGFGEAMALVLRSHWGRIFSMGHLFDTVWAQLFGGAQADRTVPVWAAWLALLAWCAFSLAVLQRRLRAREVVR